MHSDITKNDIRIFLHKPNRDSLGEIKFFTVPQQKPELGKVNRLDFVIPYYFEQNEYRNEDGNFNDGKKKNKYFDLVKERFLLKVKWLEHEEWYIVDDIVENADVNSDTKRVTAYSLPYEMRGIRLFDWPGVLVHGEYRKESLLLEQVANNVLQQTMWKIKWIDPDLTGDNAKFRFFDFSDELTVLEALYEIAEEFQSIIEFDTENREIYFHHQDNYGRDKRYLLSHNRYLKTIQNEVKPNEIITRIVPVGKDGITINERNATGSPYLQDFSYYMQPFQRDEDGNVIKSSDWLSDSLCHALLDYSELVKQKEEEYADLLNVRELLIRDLSDKETEIFNTELELFIVQDLIDVKQSQGENASSELSQENDLEIELNTLWDEWDDIDQSLTSNQQSLEDITVELSVENNFTEEQYNELSPFINTEVWKNDNLFTVEDLTEAAKDYFATINFPKRKMTISLVDFLDLVEVDEKLKDVQLGDKFNLYYERFNINVQIQVIAMDINYGTGSVVLTIANVKDVFKNDNDEIAKLIYQNKMVSGSVMKNKHHWDKAPQIEADLNRYTTGSFDSSLQEIMSGVDNSVTVNRRGITVTNMNDPNHFLRITNGAMLITRDGGETAALAISPEGLHAEVIFGRLLTGEQLVIEDEEGTFVIQGNILKITDRNDRTRVELGEYEPNQFGLRVFNKAGTQTVLDEDGILQTWQEGKADNVDSSNGLSLWVYLPPETLSVRQARLNFRLLPFRAYSRGTSSGGSSSPTSVAGGGSTQASLGGGSVSKSTLGGGSYGDSSAAGGDHHHVMFTFENDIPLNMYKRRYHVRDSIVVNLETQSGTNLQTAQSSGNHTHSFWVPNHTHEFSVPSHTHNVVIPNHSHVVNIPAHTHGIDYGIYTSTAATNVGVWINGTNRTSALGGTFASSRSNLNITQYMQTGQWNEIVLTSSRLGRLDANVFVQAFMST